MSKFLGINIGLTDVLKVAGGGVFGAGLVAYEKLTGRDTLLSKENTANDYALTRLSIDPLSFSGSYADLMALISTEADQCAAYTKSKGVLVNQNTARAQCLDSITAIYSEPLQRLQAANEADNQTAKAQLFASSNSIWIIGGAALLLILFIMYQD